MITYDNRCKDDWETPPEVWRLLRCVHDTEWFDPCPLGGTGGLEHRWTGPAYVNPPYSDLLAWSDKALESLALAPEMVFVGPDVTSSRWWQQLMLRSAAVCFASPRLSFLKQGQPVRGNPRGSTFFYFGGCPVRFCRVFGHIGVSCCTEGTYVL